MKILRISANQLRLPIFGEVLAVAEYFAFEQVYYMEIEENEAE